MKKRKRVEKILNEQSIETTKKYVQKLKGEREYTLEIFECLDMKDDEKKEYEEMNMSNLVAEKDYVEIEIEKQKKYTSDFRLNIFSFFAAIIAVIVTILIFNFSSAQTQMININEKIDAANQELIVLQHTYVNEDKAIQENNSEEVRAQAADLNEQLTQFNVQRDKVQANIDFIKGILIVSFILLIVVLGSSLYVYLTFQRNNKRSAIILVAYKKRLEFINDLIKKNQ